MVGVVSAPASSDDELIVEAVGVEEAISLPWPLLLRHRVRTRVARSERAPWIVLVASLTGLFTVGFTITILAVSLSTIAEDLGTTTATLTWVITGPMLAFGVVGPSIGRLGDVIGHKRLYLAGLAGCMVFAALTALSWNAGSLIAFRILGAAMGAATGPASMAMINRVFEPAERVKALGYWSLVGAGAPVLGAVVGGPVVQAFGWRWIFVAQAPACAVALVIAYLFLNETERKPLTERFDVEGAVLLAVGITGLLFALNRSSVWGWLHPIVLTCVVLSPLALVAFVRVERRAADPLIPLAYFHRRNFSAPLGNQLLCNAAYMGGFILTPLLLHDALGFDETHVALLVLFRPLAFSITGPIAGYLTVRIGERTAGVTGALFVGASMVALSTIGVGSTDVMIVGALVLSGIGLGISSPAMSAAVANSVDTHDLGVAGATQQLMSQVGAVSGIQLLQTVQASQEPVRGLVPSYGVAYLTGAALCMAAAALAMFVRSSER